MPEPISPVVPDDRVDPPFLASERAGLESWLELYRSTVPIKVGGLSAKQLCARSVPPSTLSPVGIVRHLAFVERYWSADVVAGHPLPRLYCEADPDGDLHDTDPSTALADLDRYAGEVSDARARIAVVTDLDAPLPGLRQGQQLNLRWVLVHLIEEYARHLGHLDLLRECIDGSTGY